MYHHPKSSGSSDPVLSLNQSLGIRTMSLSLCRIVVIRVSVLSRKVCVWNRWSSLVHPLTDVRNRISVSGCSSFSDDEEGLHDTYDEIQGYLCVSSDPRRSGSSEGGGNLIITVKKLRLSVQDQRKVDTLQMSSPGDISHHSPETTGTVNGRPSPLNDRK